MILPSSPSSNQTSVPEPVCDVCGSADRLGIDVCVTCARTDSDALLFLEPSKRRADRRVLEAWLVGALDGAVSRSDAREVAEGLRPLVRLPSPAAGRAAGILTVRGVGATTVESGQAWRRVPGGFAILAGIAGGIGLFLGLTGSTWALLLAPLFPALLILAAFQQLKLPVWQPETASVFGLSKALERRVRATLARLPQGRARGRLKDLAELVVALRDADDLPADRELDTAAEEFLRLACDATTDLDQLDRALAILDQDASEHQNSDASSDAIARAEAVRDGLLTRLDEASATLVSAQAASTDSATHLLHAAKRLGKESQVRAEAWLEVERLTR